MQEPIKPQMKITQMVSSTTASKQFGSLRERAKIEPQFILDHNKVDTVVLSYEAYESMYTELQTLRAQR